MSLEATMVILDNSACAINGDYFPTRIGAQIECATMIIQNKLDANPENAAGLVTMGGKFVEVLCTPTNDPEQVQAYLFGIRCHGKAKFSQALQISNLALKHRTNQNQRMRLVVFVASALSESENDLIQLAKKMKKANIAVDVIAIGELAQAQKDKLLSFHQAVNSGDNSLLSFIEPTQGELRQFLEGTSLTGAEMNLPQEGVPGQGNNNVFVDPNMDPEMAEAIRISLLEEEERQKRLKEQKDVKENEFSEKELLQKAKNLSMQEEQNNADKKKLLEDENFVAELLENIEGEDEEEELLKKDKDQKK